MITMQKKKRFSLFLLWHDLFCYLLRALDITISIQMIPHPAFYDHWFYTILYGEQKKKN